MNMLGILLPTIIVAIVALVGLLVAYCRYEDAVRRHCEGRGCPLFPTMVPQYFRQRRPPSVAAEAMYQRWKDIKG